MLLEREGGIPLLRKRHSLKSLLAFLQRQIPFCNFRYCSFFRNAFVKTAAYFVRHGLKIENLSSKLRKKPFSLRREKSLLFTITSWIINNFFVAFCVNIAMILRWFVVYQSSFCFWGRFNG